MNRKQPPLSYPVRAAARLTGLTPDTLRAWERRHAAVVPTRDARGRAYSAGDINRLRLLRDAVEHGHSIGAIAGLSNDCVAALLAQPDRTAAAAARPASRPDAAGLTTALLAAARDYDGAGVEQEFGRLAAALGPRELVLDVVLPVLRAIGDAWERGDMRAGQEHLVSSVLRHALGGILRMVSVRQTRGRMVLATLPGERHEFGILSAALLAASAGVGTTYLGTDLPAAEIAEATVRSQASVVVLGFTASDAIESARHVRELRRMLPATVAIWSGGPASPRSSAIRTLSSLDEFEAALDHYRA